MDSAWEQKKLEARTILKNGLGSSVSKKKRSSQSENGKEYNEASQRCTNHNGICNVKDLR
jgi:hypothetical protein